MPIPFSHLKNVEMNHLSGGQGTVGAKRFTGHAHKIMVSRLAKGCSVGTHCHSASSESNDMLSGGGIAVCDGEEEALRAGVCHYCPLGSVHSIRNTGNEELVLFTVVTEQPVFAKP